MNETAGILIGANPPSVIYTLLWPGLAAVFLAGALFCFCGRKRMFGSNLAIVGLLLIGSWQYNRTHETSSSMQLAFVGQKLVKEDRERPEQTVYQVTLSGLELGVWRANVRAADIRITTPGTIVLVEFRKRPLTGTYIKSVASLPRK